MTTVVDQVITVFDAIWKGEGAAKSSLLSLQQYEKAGGRAAIAHQKIAVGTDAARRSIMDLGQQVASGTITTREAEKAFDGLSATIANNEDEMQRLIPTQNSVASTFAKIGMVAGGAIAAFGAVGIAVKTTTAAFNKLMDAAATGAGLSQLRDSFNYLNETVMHTPGLLNDMVAATNNTLSEAAAMQGIMTLVAGSTESLTQAFAKAAPRLAEIAKAANKLNPTLGDTNFMFESIGRGIKRLEPRLLDNLGLNVRMASANERWAEANNRTITSMTAEEKVMAALNETLRVGNNLIQQVGGNVESAVDPMLRLAAATTDLENAWLELLGAVSLGQNAMAENKEEQTDQIRVQAMINRMRGEGLITWERQVDLMGDARDGTKTYAQVLNILERVQQKHNESIRSSIARGMIWRDIYAAPFQDFGEAPQEAIRGATKELNRFNDEILTMKEGLLEPGVSDPSQSLDRLLGPIRAAQNVEVAKAAVKQIDELIKNIREMDAATGDYAMQAFNADKESSLFNQTISELGESYVRVGGRTADQNELLDDIQSAYDKSAKQVRDYSSGLKGFGQEQDTVNKKIEEGQEAMAHYSALMAPLEGITGDLTKRNIEATWNQENINQAILDAADAAGANSRELIKYQLATGMITEVQAEAALKSAEFQEEIVKLGARIDDGISPEQIESDVERIMAALDRLTLGDFLGTAPQPLEGIYDVGGVRGLLEDADNVAIDPLGDMILGDNADETIDYLEEIRKGAEMVITSDGVEEAKGDLQSLLSLLQAIAGTWKFDVEGDVPTGGGSEPPGPPPEQFGGPVQQGASYFVGERRPELFVPNVNGRIYPNGGGSGGGVTNIHNYNKEAAAVSMAMLGMRRRQAVDSLAGVA